MDVTYFNKLINDEEEHFEDLNFDLSYEFNNLSKKNIYVRKILIIWEKNKINDNLIKISKDEIIFIEQDFEGDFNDYLIFIIPRITKLNSKHLNKIILEENFKKVEDSEDKEYINILEFNMSNIQIELNNLSETFLKKILILEERIENYEKFIEEKLDSFEKIIDEKINKNFTENKKSIDDLELKNQEKFFNFQKNAEDNNEQFSNQLNIKQLELDEKLVKQENYTKNSIQILEKRFSKILQVLKL
tara:strand:- start:54 stop:791 length:738 start_codon:yes stop_codon:yes gene_type:complete